MLSNCFMVFVNIHFLLFFFLSIAVPLSMQVLRHLQSPAVAQPANHLAQAWLYGLIQEKSFMFITNFILSVKE